MKFRMLLVGLALLTAVAGCTAREVEVPVSEPNPAPGDTAPAPGGEAPSGENPADSVAQGDAVRVSLPAIDTEIAGDTIHVEGQARVFEATLLAEVEDGHDILGRAVITASDGAPNWGDFAADIKLEQRPTNRSLTLILYVESAKDGSRIELAHIPLRYTGPCADSRC